MSCLCLLLHIFLFLPVNLREKVCTYIFVLNDVIPLTSRTLTVWLHVCLCVCVCVPASSGNVEPGGISFDKKRKVWSSQGHLDEIAPALKFRTKIEFSISTFKNCWRGSCIMTVDQWSSLFATLGVTKTWIIFGLQQAPNKDAVDAAWYSLPSPCHVCGKPLC